MMGAALLSSAEDFNGVDYSGTVREAGGCSAAEQR